MTYQNYGLGSGLGLMDFKTPSVEPTFDFMSATKSLNPSPWANLGSNNSMANWGSGTDLSFGYPSTPSPSAGDAPFWSWKAAIGDKNTPGWGGLALGGVTGLANLFMGMKQYGLAKDSLAQQKEQFEKQYEAQRSLTNSQLSDRQRARVASNPGAYESEYDYMKKYGIA